MDSPMSDRMVMDIDPIPAATGTRKRKCTTSYDEKDVVSGKVAERVRLCMEKPSHVLQLTVKPLRVENRVRLRYLLRRLLKQHNWGEASGVLSMYLKGTIMDRSPIRNHFKYSVLPEILKHMGENHHVTTKMKDLFDVWMRKNGTMKSWPKEDRYRVHLEYIMFCLMQGSIEDAHQAAISLKQENEASDDTLANMVLGLTFYELWYSGIPQERKWRYSKEFDSIDHSDISGTRLINQAENADFCNSNQSHMSDASYHCNSDISVKNEKRKSSDTVNNQQMKFFMEGNVNHEIEKSPSVLPVQNLYLNSDENLADGQNYNGGNMECPFFLSAIGDDNSWLLPLRLPRQNDNVEEFVNIYGGLFNDYYKDAVKHLQQAVYSKPPLSAALLPWIQLMLIGGQVNEALAHLEHLSSVSDTAQPNRLRVALLECFDRNNLLLSNCLEDVMKKDPSCSDVLAKLVRMHQNGDYSLESLLEMIAIHLEATYGDSTTWKEFAACFLKLSYSEEDQMSAFTGGVEYKSSSQTSLSLLRVPTIFTEGDSGDTWRLRCRWWLTRHFCKDKLTSDIAAGDLELLTHKAACASHIYGREFGYVAEAMSHLKKENDRNLLLALKLHMNNSVGFYPKIHQ